MKNPTDTTLDHHWMPFTANRDFKANTRLQVRAEGMYYWNDRGEKILDGCSGLFCVAAGHGRPEIREAVARQLGELDYTPHFQLGFPGSFELARQLAGLTPADLNRLFFTCSGLRGGGDFTQDRAGLPESAGRGAAGQAGRPRACLSRGEFRRLIGRGIGRNREAFGPLLPGVLHLRHTWLPENRFTQGRPEHGAELADDLERLVQTHGNTIAACIVEPIAGSTGALVPPKGYLERLRQICDRYGILLIFDEVITGFGRLGKPFAAQAFGVTPDIIAMAKGITNGCLPMGAVAVRDGIYESIVEAASSGGIELFHGYTYSGAPAAVAAALAALEIYRKEGLFERAAKMSPLFLDAIFSLRDLPAVTDIRGYGMIAGIDLAPRTTRLARPVRRLFWASTKPVC